MTQFNQHYLLGHSGLRVVSLALGTWTFGDLSGFGAVEETARDIFFKYIDAGGNFFDTAENYQNGNSEKMLGKFISEAGIRENVVIATKYSFGAQPGNLNAGGNGRKNLMRAIEGSLNRLKTDYIDLYWVHAWDGLTPVEEVIASLDTLVKSGKVRYIGLSNCPAWYISEAQTLAKIRGYEPIIAIQFEYNLTERSIEREHIPMALHQGMGVCSWSPLAGGLLTGKHTRGVIGEGRLKAAEGSGNPIMEKYVKTPRNWEIVDTLLAISKQLDRSPAQVALNWITRRPGVSATILGVTKLSQLEDNLQALEFEIPPPLWSQIEEVSRPELCTPYDFFVPPFTEWISGGARVQSEPSWFREKQASKGK